MKIVALCLLVVGVGILMTCSKADPQPPVADVVPHELEAHGDVRVDDYFWLRERENPAVIAYLEAENAYMDAVTFETEQLQLELFEEIKGRIKQTDSSVPDPTRAISTITGPKSARNTGSTAASKPNPVLEKRCSSMSTRWPKDTTSVRQAGFG